MQLDGLERRPELNGRVGTARRFDEQKQRWQAGEAVSTCSALPALHILGFVRKALGALEPKALIIVANALLRLPHLGHPLLELDERAGRRRDADDVLLDEVLAVGVDERRKRQGVQVAIGHDDTHLQMQIEPGERVIHVLYCRERASSVLLHSRGVILPFAVSDKEGMAELIADQGDAARQSQPHLAAT